ncbi:MAG TPA: 2OG-Fe(II) oxygenase family protein [Woeseiaceae bacterium]|nr:2OG-Fe(II) oxygenase family protein [Woeseiaceae bacterium]
MPKTELLNFKDPIAGQLQESCPVIRVRDLVAGGPPALALAARDACRTQGFLLVEFETDQQKAIQRTVASMRTFFACNNRIKSRVAIGDGRNGWTPSGQEPAYQPGTISNVESFDVMSTLIAGENDAKWPENAEFRHATIDCWNSLFGLAGPLLELIANALEIAPDFLRKNCSTRTLNTLRLLRYPPAPRAVNSSDVGIAAHTDFECISLLYQTAPGLELRDVNGRWLDAPTAPNRLVILLGDMLETWTNGYLQATGHRVRRTADERFSIVMFIAVNEGFRVEPLAQFVSGDRPAAYSATDQRAHTDAELARARDR